MGCSENMLDDLKGSIGGSSKPEAPAPDKITLSQQTMEVGFEPDTYSIDVSSPYSWKAESDNEWIVVESKTGIAGTEQLSFSIAHNEEEKVRKGTILLTNSTYNLAAEFYIVQVAFVPEISFSPETMNFLANGGEESIAVTANFEHKATTETDWLSITKTWEGYIIEAFANPELEERTAEIVISNEKYGISDVVNITQSAFVPSELSVIPTALNFSANGGEESIAVTANFEHKATTETDWLSITKTWEGYIIEAFANPELEERTAEIVISNEKYGISEIIQITQERQDERLLIYYTSERGSVVMPPNLSAFGANIIWNTYINGIGVIVFDSEVTTIGYAAFRGCSSLTSVTIPDSVTSIGYEAFSGCSSLTSVTIPNNVTTIGYAAFVNCSSLTSVTIPDSVTTIGDYAFAGCSSLTSVTIPDSVTTIGEMVFRYCSSLTSVTIGDSVTTIGEVAFSGCYNLTSVYCKATTPPAGSSDMFYGNASDRKIYVPMESVEAYKSASYWSNYSSYIVGYNF